MRALLVYNPIAGRRGPRREMPAAIAELEAGGWTVEPAHTEGPGHASRLAEQASIEGFDVVIAAGGDGTVNQVAGGLMKAHQAGEHAAALAILPAGTANVLARDLGLPAPGPGLRNTLPAAARMLLRSQLEWVDVGRARNAIEERVFICWAGVGLDAAITAHVMAHPEAKRRLGPLYFAVSAVRHVPQVSRAPHFTIRADESVWEGKALLVVASNIKHYAVVLDMAPQASLNDGLLDLAFFHNLNLRNGLNQLLLLSQGQHIDDPGVGYTQARRIAIEAETPQPVHLDAEPFGMTPLAIEVVPQALPLLVPPSQAAFHLVPPKLV